MPGMRKYILNDSETPPALLWRVGRSRGRLQCCQLLRRQVYCPRAVQQRVVQIKYQHQAAGGQ